MVSTIKGVHCIAASEICLRQRHGMSLTASYEYHIYGSNYQLQEYTLDDLPGTTLPRREGESGGAVDVDSEEGTGRQ